MSTWGKCSGVPRTPWVRCPVVWWGRDSTHIRKEGSRFQLCRKQLNVPQVSSCLKGETKEHRSVPRFMEPGGCGQELGVKLLTGRVQG